MIDTEEVHLLNIFLYKVIKCLFALIKSYAPNNKKLKVKKMQTIICMKWGNRYNSNYVNNLYSSIQTHTKNKTRLICFTDDKKYN